MIIANYILLLTALIVHAPEQLWQPDSRAFLVLLGFVGAWRYSWGFLHFVRSWYYRHVVFGRYRRTLNRLQQPSSDLDTGERIEPELIGPSELFIIVTSFRIHAETTAACYRSIFDEARRSGRKVTVVASIVEMADQRFIKRVFENSSPGPEVRLMFVRLQGIGKREALAVALNAVTRRRPSKNAAVAVMDGDSLMTPDCINRTLPFFAMFPKMGGLTTDEDSIIAGSWLMGTWHRLRFAQRQMLMSSMALSGRILTMTGRFSLFRLDIATHPDFIEAVRNDQISDWRLGRIKLLTGEDKSTWFWLLKNGWQMLYVPDVRIWTVEHPPAGHFFSASTMLMTRWFGNMLRASGRAIALGPARCGWFVWWCLIDQRLSMWTPLIGPVAAILASVVYSPWIMYAYVVWVMFTRLIQTMMLLSVRDTISGAYPPLIYFSQVYGAFIKTFVLFRPYRQRWTRQDIASSGSGQGALVVIQSTLLHVLALAYLVTIVGFLLGVLSWPNGALMTGPF